MPITHPANNNDEISDASTELNQIISNPSFQSPC